MKKIIDLLYKLNSILNRKQKILGVVVLLLSLGGAVLETVGVSSIMPLVNVMLTPELITDMGFFSVIINILGIETYSEVILLVAIFTIAIFVAKNIYFVILSWVRVKYSCKIQREISVKMLDVYFDKEYVFFLNKNTSKLTREVHGDVSGVQAILYQGLRLITELLTISLVFVYLLFTDFIMGLLLACLAGGCLLIIDLGFRKKMHEYGKQFRFFTARVNQTLIEGFQGVKEVLILRKKRYFVDKYQENIIKQQEAQISQTVGAECPAYIIEAVCIVGILLSIAVRSTSAEAASATIPALSTFVVGAFRILPALGRISTALNGITYAIPSLNAVYENMNDLKDEFTEKAALSDKVDLRDYVFSDKVSVDNVTFAYDKKIDNVIEELSMDIHRGESVAFIGHSGSGKTTLADIILGLLIPQKGKIKMDEYEINQIPDTWSRTIGYVAQSVYLLDASIRTNVAFGIPDAQIDEEHVWNCLEQAQLKDFVMQLPDKLETRVGDRGVRFSGGQRQRLAIARALYCNPQILVLDEATSALDNETEQAVMDAIDSLHGKVTLIIVAHRLSTVENCDVIYEVKDKKAIRVNKENLFQK